MWRFPDESEKRQASYPLPPARYIRRVNDLLAAGMIPNPPTPPPDNQRYEMFGVTYQENNPLLPLLVDADGYRVEFSENASKKEQMKTFNINILYQFLDLLKQFENAQPTQDLLKIIEMEFVKLMHLINEYRPFMHSNNLIEMLMEQKTGTLEEVEKLTDVVKKSVRSLRFHVFPRDLEVRDDLLPSEHGKACESEAKCMFCAAYDEHELRQASQ